MFVYKFMSGVVETIGVTTGFTEETDYDPHKHRIVEKPTSYADTMIHLLKGSIGAGMLAMPEAMRRIGITAGIPGLLLLGAFCVYCLQMLIASQYRICKRWRRGYIAYPKAMRLSLQDGPPCCRSFASPLSKSVDGVLLLWQLGVCTVYMIFTSANFQQVLGYYGYSFDIRTLLCIVLVPSVLVNLIRDLKLLAPFSATSNGITLCAIILVFFYLVEDDVDIKDEMFHLKDPLDIGVFLGTALFSMEAVGVMLALEYNMENPKRFVGWFGLLNIGMAIVVAVYLFIGVLGYVKYGDDIKASITLNLPEDQKKAQCAKLMFAVAIFLSFPLQNFVAYNIIWRKLKKSLMRNGSSNIKLMDYILRVMCVLIPWSFAVAIPKLGPFITLIGAFCLSLLAIIFPAIMDICWWWSDKGFGPCYFRLWRDIFIIIFGFICLASGVMIALMEMSE